MVWREKLNGDLLRNILAKVCVALSMDIRRILRALN